MLGVVDPIESELSAPIIVAEIGTLRLLHYHLKKAIFEVLK